MAADEKKLPFLFIVGMFLIVVSIFSWAMWAAFSHEIMWFLKWLCIGELYIIDLFVNNPDILKLIDRVESIQRNSLEFRKDVAPLLLLSGVYIRYPIALLFSFYAWNCYKHPPKKMLRQKHDLDSLIKFQSEAWPYISPFVDYNPGKESSRAVGDPVPRKLPVFAESLAPEEWLVYNDIEVDPKTFEFDEKRAKRVFQSQVGLRWKGVDNAPEYARVLMAGFALKVARQRDDADVFLGEVAKCWTREKGLVLTPQVKTKMNNILKPSQAGQTVADIMNLHAYFVTAIIALLEYARKRGGVLAPAQFLWLRGVDRELWYALNSLGRRTYFTESSGAMSHYFVEKSLGKPIVSINVDNAMISLKSYLNSEYPEIPLKEQYVPKKENTGV